MGWYLRWESTEPEEVLWEGSRFEDFSEKGILSFVVVSKKSLVKTFYPTVSGILGHMARLKKDIVVKASIFDMGFLRKLEQMPH